MLDSEVRQRVMVDDVESGQPLKWGFVFTAPRDLACRTDSATVRIQPQADEQSRIRCRTPRLSLNRSNRSQKTGEIKSAYKIPNCPGWMIVLNQTLDINHVPAHLLTIYMTHSRHT